MATAEEFSEDQKKDLENLFRAKDVDNSGTLSTDELEECLHLLGLYPTEEELAFFKSSFDKNGDGKLQISELVDNAHTLITHSLTTDDLIGAFKALDTSGDGYIRYTELKAILCHNGFMTGDESSKLITTLSDKFDENYDGKFSYTEFVKMYLSEVYQNAMKPE